MKTLQRIIQASALALALAAVPTLASAATPADAQAPTDQAPCSCTGGQHHMTGCDGHAEKASTTKARTASQDRESDRAFDLQAIP